MDIAPRRACRCICSSTPVAWILLHVELIAAFAAQPLLCDIEWYAASNERRQCSVLSFVEPNIVEIYFALFVRQNAFPALVARESLEKPVAWILLHVELIATLAVRPYLCDIERRAASNESQQGSVAPFAVPTNVEPHFAFFVRRPNASAVLVVLESLG
jgi:hypothetical protein